MKIYIASSWRNQHAVEMLTDLLEKIEGVEVKSFVRDSNEEQQQTHLEAVKNQSFEEWLWSDRGLESFKFDTTSAMTSDLVIMLSPIGKDATCELGMAYAKSVPIYSLWAKSEDLGLMRRIITKNFSNYKELISELQTSEFIKGILNG
jgi:hypothetical protein